jgi:hypothetical protein
MTNLIIIIAILLIAAFVYYDSRPLLQKNIKNTNRNYTIFYSTHHRWYSFIVKAEVL